MLLWIPVIFFSGCDHSTRFASDKDSTIEDIQLTPEQAMLLENAVSDYSAYGCMCDHIAVFDHDNAMWEDKRRSMAESNIGTGRLRDELKGRNYQVIKLELMPDMLGGDVWYFMDIGTKDVITVYGEK